MQHLKTFLHEARLEEKGAMSMLSRAALDDKRNKHIWNLSDNALAWDDGDAFYDYLCKDFGDYYLYIAYKNDLPLGIFGMLNLSDRPGCANIIVWVDRSARRSFYVMRWFCLFLREAQEKGVHRWYANIKLVNSVSLHSSERYGFGRCDAMGENMLNVKARCVMRATSFNSFERAFVDRYMPYL
ncbi:hypothetical protein [Ectothiorhodospira variabilis]|uniref:hypothetical protein n=1 Tax=Ectothiorhodospira variabilis TaxID=505694 RepID=UPI001EFA474F|nr:hypothetical protein [Ectothiorhodospira variabilis]MCG5497505.1 hypothetical protein [Ectothiorhodospira variabilis]